MDDENGGEGVPGAER
jgi:hypothetical protein